MSESVEKLLEEVKTRALKANPKLRMKILREDIPRLIATLRKAVEQRDGWIGDLEAKEKKHFVDHDNAALAALLRGEVGNEF